MKTRGRVSLIIPVHNEAESLPTVLKSVPDCIDDIIVVDNGSSDGSGDIARAHGAEVIREERLGYGQACLSGLAVLRDQPPRLVAFADGDGSDNHPQLQQLIETLEHEEVDLVLAQRVPKNRAALSMQQRFGNGLATFLISLLWGGSFQDLGPMRVIRWQALERLKMADRNFGWTIEMQIKALQQQLSFREVPLLYLPRLAGQSKISRTFKGVFSAGGKILWIIAREAWFDRAQILRQAWRRIKRRIRTLTGALNT